MSEHHPETLSTVELGLEILRLDRLRQSLAERLEAVKDRQKLCEQSMAGRARDLPPVPGRQAIQVGNVAFWAEGHRLEWRELVNPFDDAARPEAPEEFDE